MKKHGKEGFTLIEMMIVVSIIAILAAIAVPIYRNYVFRGKQVEAKTLLMTIKVEQEQFHAEFNCYTLNLVDLPESNRVGASASVYKKANITISGSNTTPCNMAGRANDFQTVVTGKLGSGKPDDKWGISDRISAPVHCDGRSGYSADQLAACPGGTTSEMEY